MAFERSLRNAVRVLVGVLLLTCGCYRGAIYSSYQEAGLGIRTTAESGAPVKVHFGYDRSVGAFVPRRGGDNANEEATSIISKDDVGANVKPGSTENLLTVDSALITGTAAIVASAPEQSEVTIAPAAGAPRQIFITSGDAGERIATALNPVKFNSDPAAAPLRKRVNTWMKANPQNRSDLKTWLTAQGLAGPETGAEASWLWSASTDQLEAAISKFSIP